MEFDKNKFMKVVSVVIVVSLLLGLSTVFLVQEEKDTDEKKVSEEIQIDDRVSPFLNQGLVVEINRIRNRLLMEKMLTFGTDWKQPPTFFWTAIVDGKEHATNEICSAGGVEGSGAFTEWDTFGKESKANFYIVDGKKTSEITILIIEEQSTGLFGRKTEHVEKERIELTYDYRTGHWTGDDYVRDNDGYGHVLGKEYEIWFNVYQSDYDHDKIPYWMEVNMYHFDPTIADGKIDADKDGIPSWWEWKYGYDPLSFDNHSLLDPDIDGLSNEQEYFMYKYFADPFHQDIYLEIDGMKKRGLLDWNHESYEETHQMLIERFAQHNINLYIDYGWPDGPVNGGGELVEYMHVNDDTVGHFHNRFYRHNFADERKGIFRYCMVAANAGFISPGDFNYYDHIVVDTGQKVTLKRLGFTPKYQRVLLAKGILHEMGHSLGLMPYTFYGVDILTGQWKDRWPNQLTEAEYENYCEQYYSIMNYGYIFGKNKKQIRCFDYSDGSNGPPFDQNDWEHIYVPAFKTSQSAYEEAQPKIDNIFEDIEVVTKNPDMKRNGWSIESNLSNDYNDVFDRLTFVDNTDCDFLVLVKEDSDWEENEKQIAVYAKPNVEPTVTTWTLVVEGSYNEYENSLFIYSFQQIYEELISLL